MWSQPTKQTNKQTNQPNHQTNHRNSGVGLAPHLGSDQTSCHNPFAGGYYPAGLTYEASQAMMADDPDAFKAHVQDSLRRQVYTHPCGHDIPELGVIGGTIVSGPPITHGIRGWWHQRIRAFMCPYPMFSPPAPSRVVCVLLSS